MFFFLTFLYRTSSGYPILFIFRESPLPPKLEHTGIQAENEKLPVPEKCHLPLHIIIEHLQTKEDTKEESGFKSGLMRSTELLSFLAKFEV